MHIWVTLEYLVHIIRTRVDPLSLSLLVATGTQQN